MTANPRLCAALGLALLLAAPALRSQEAPAQLPVLYVCGDSTAARDRPPILGWGERIGEFFDPAKVKVENHAAAGRSARTYIEEGRWEAVRRRLQPGDVVLLQFGHNDSKSALSLARYDLSGVGEEKITTTDPLSGKTVEIRTFGWYLRKMATEAKAAGATVVILSPIPRARWENGSIVRGEERHGSWAAAVARQAGVAFVDVNAIIADLYDPIGPARLKEMYFPVDNTHTNPAGALLNAACVVHGLSRLGDPAIEGCLKPGAARIAEADMRAASASASAFRISINLAGAFPAPGAAEVCPDTPLKLAFDAPPTLGSSGFIRIHDAADGRVVESIDVSSPTAVKTIGGLAGYRYYPVIVTGTRASIYPRSGVLAYGRSYYVTVDAGVFQDGSQPYAAVNDPSAWRFSTKASPPSSGADRITVAADGRGDFCTVQGALDFIPEGNTRPVTIFVRAGTYTEMVFFTGKNSVTIRGEDRKRTVIEYATNDRFNPGTGNPYAAPGANPSGARPAHGHIYHRGVLIAHRVKDFTLENLTVRNTTPRGGSQSEAIIFNGTDDAHAIVRDVDLYSFQDTLQINGQAYIADSYIEGDVDFMWGNGPSFFENCLCRSVSSSCYYTQIRNPAGHHGFVYYHCTFDGNQGVMGNYLARIEPNRFPASEVVLIDCILTHAVRLVGWQLQGFPDDAVPPPTLHFWEYNSRRPDGQPVDTSDRLGISRRLTEPADAETIAHYSDPAWVLGGWNPKASLADLAPAAAPAGPRFPRFTRQPSSVLALLGTDPLLSAAAEDAPGTGRITYQWYKDGSALPGAGEPTLRLRGMTMADEGTYVLAARNTAGTTLSEAAELSAVQPDTGYLDPELPPRVRMRSVRRLRPAPALPSIPDAVFDVTAFGAVGDGSSDDTAAIRRAIEAAGEAGGGIVFIPSAPAPYLSGPLVLPSKINLQIDFGATLKALPYPSAGATGAAYPAPGKGGRYADFITVNAAQDVALTGGGTIDGQGAAWWRAFAADHRMPHRPYLIRISRAQRVLVSGLHLTDSPMFHLAVGANQLTVFGLTVRAPISPNTDGVDPSGSHQLIQACDIACGDDNIAVKAGGEFCSDITVADCIFGIGHGLSVGGQSNAGLDGMTVRNVYFHDGTAGLRLKADATQGGPVANISYSDVAMEGVSFPVEFYSYYRNAGNPGETHGRNNITPGKVRDWNANPPNPLSGRHLPSWKNLSIDDLVSLRSGGWSIIWGLPLPGYLVEHVRLNNVRISGGPGFRIYDAADVQFSGRSDVGPVTVCNALVLLQQPKAAELTPGQTAVFSIETAGPANSNGDATRVEWRFDDTPISGFRTEETTVPGSGRSTLRVTRAGPAAAGRYAAEVSALLDGYDPAVHQLKPASIPVSLISAPAPLRLQ